MTTQHTFPTFTVPKTPQTPEVSGAQLVEWTTAIQQALIEHDATLIAHYYTNAAIQAIAEKTGGFVGDSLAMARFGHQSSSSTLLVAGVRFMAETAKIINPEKTVIPLAREAECSLDLGCPAEQFRDFCQLHPDHVVVVYANTSAAVKAQADWVVTSSNAVAIVEHLQASGQRILWAPDQHLGRYIQSQTGAEMVIWQGACVVHDEFKSTALRQLMLDYPEAAVLVHPESPAEVVAMADVVGSTTRLLNASVSLPNQQFIVATDRGLFYKMQQQSPSKQFIAAPTAGVGASCHCCAHCPWMAMNHPDQIIKQLKQGVQSAIVLDPETIERAQHPLYRMLNFQH